MKRIKRLVLLCCLAFLFLNGCSETEQKIIVDDLKHAMNQAKIQYDEILHIEVIKDGVQVFYVNQSDLNAGFIRNTSDGWKWIIGEGSVSLQAYEGLSWLASNNNNNPSYYIFGVISNSDITQVKTKKPDGTQEETAKIVVTKEGIRLWFIHYDQPVNAPMDVIGLSKDGEILYQ